VLTVHHLNNSRSQRVLWLLEELSAPYTVLRYERDPKTLRAPEALRRIHPLGKSPVITEGEETIAESGAITEYLIERYGAGRLRPPPGSAAHARYRYWLHYAEGSAMPPLLLKLVFLRIPRAPAPWYARPIIRGLAGSVQARFVDPELRGHARYWEDALAAHPWFAGEEFSAADIQMSFPMEVIAARLPEALGERSRAFLERIHARPAYQRALKAGGEFGIVG
jgi:glutathione S-transferase